MPKRGSGRESVNTCVMPSLCSRCCVGRYLALFIVITVTVIVIVVVCCVAVALLY